MSGAPVPLALSVWGELLEVIVVGAVAGIGLAIAFAFLVRGAAQSSAIRHGEREGSLVLNLALVALTSAICIGAVVFAVYEMVSG
ncbi:hypothetical protein [Patulibacter sp.]|uniref:hypothetical protein n=1 Tax=Patulibacter sp. TaxID=1912859 RepID=UPI00271C81A8|nr:hypothetical protein [Patulibacter sp.]MDO9406817.1 hypothetical protein [Patulibacter sp.]